MYIFMQKIKNTAFTLVELLVVITILAIISVVAYQNFGSAVWKAVSGRKISDVSTIETSLQQYKVDKNHYPATDIYDSNTNMWGYNSGATSTPSNTIDVTMNGAEIASIDNANWGWIIRNTAATPQQIGAKGTISQNTLTKQYLSKDLFDPEIGELKETTNNKKLIEYGLGRYVYAVYKKPTGLNWSDNKTGTYYNIAYTVQKEGSDSYITKIVWDYDKQSCFDNANICPDTLVGLVDQQEQGKDSSWWALSNFASTQPNQGIPYPVSDFE